MYWRCIAETHTLLTKFSVLELVQYHQKDNSSWRVELGQALSRTGYSHKIGVVVNVKGINLIST